MDTNDVNDFDVSQLKWWRCVAVDANDKIQVSIIKIETDNIYREFNKIRQGLKSKGMRFVEARPITKEEVLAAEKVAHLKSLKKRRLQGLTGQRYSFSFHWPIALFVVLSTLLTLLLAYLH
jgi:hypothetical protein